MTNKNKLIGVGIILFCIVIGSAFYISYLLAQKTSQKNYQPPEQSSAEVRKTTQQIKKISFKNLETEETMELWADGTVNYFDKYGKLKKTGRRGFAETAGKFRDLEKLINANKKIKGYEGYQIIIETEQGTIVVNPGDDGEGDDTIEDIHDYVDHTVNPTPRPSPIPTSVPTSSPLPSTAPTPNPSATPDTSQATPFDCSDYYTTGKSLKISNIICGSGMQP